jgi:hypothetical protein
MLFQTARKSLILKWRDGGVVDRARLEIDSRSRVLTHTETHQSSSQSTSSATTIRVRLAM